MSKSIFVNLPVIDLQKSKTFYEVLGFQNNPQFSDETAACMVWSDAIYVMLLTHEKWRTFTERPIPPTNSSEVMLALTCENRENVDNLNRLANENGGTSDINRSQDHGFMYSRAIGDPDGHVWELFWMDPAAIQS
ncbi:VOC family protein [Thalassoroseus pseudoceratinae]|uniref:VOC family protein n=1 Tax=Thalassoroseus pseudoceratinae TaxID=2713176 RepID=UPI00141FE578|nr:VOC family protein [Thalassoroseus pseudoceratinae]